MSKNKSNGQYDMFLKPVIKWQTCIESLIMSFFRHQRFIPLYMLLRWSKTNKINERKI